MSYNALSKFQLVESPLQQIPHKCAGCGSYGQLDSQKEKTVFVDINLEVEFYGKIFLCLTCLTEIANQVGYYSSEQYEKVANALLEANEAVEFMSIENRELKNAFNSVSRTVGVDTSSYYASNMVVPEEREELSVQSEPEPSIDESAAEIHDGSDEQNSESGSSKLSDDDSINSLLSDFNI